MKHSKSGIPRFIMKREADTADKSKPSNERSDCKPSHTTTSVIKDTEAHSERTTDCSESSIAKMTSKTVISTRATKAGRHFVTSSKESLPTHLKVVGGNNSESGIKPASSRTFKSAPPASLANNVAVIGAAPDLKVTNCRLKSLAGGLQVVAAPKSRHTLKTVAVATASGLLQPNLLSYDHDRHNGDQKYENGSDESCQSIINHETTQSEAESLNKFLQLFVGETETIAESLREEVME